MHRCAQVTTGGFGPHASSKRTHYAPREIETQPDARNLALSCAPRAPISFEQARQLVGVEANTAIMDTNLNRASINTHDDVDYAVAALVQAVESLRALSPLTQERLTFAKEPVPSA